MNLYVIKGSKIKVSYLNGELMWVFICGDLIGWNGMRHEIPFLEVDIDDNLFQLIEDGTNT